MKFLQILKKGNRKSKEEIRDYYQLSVEKLGREQFQKLSEKGLNIPIVLL